MKEIIFAFMLEEYREKYSENTEKYSDFMKV